MEEISLEEISRLDTTMIQEEAPRPSRKERCRAINTIDHMCAWMCVMFIMAGLALTSLITLGIIIGGGAYHNCEECVTDINNYDPSSSCLWEPYNETKFSCSASLLDLDTSRVLCDIRESDVCRKKLSDTSMCVHSVCKDDICTTIDTCQYAPIKNYIYEYVFYSSLGILTFIIIIFIAFKCWISPASDTSTPRPHD